MSLTVLVELDLIFFGPFYFFEVVGRDKTGNCTTYYKQGKPTDFHRGRAPVSLLFFILVLMVPDI